MYKFKKSIKTDIVDNDYFEGEMIEHKVRRIMLNNEPIEDTASTLFTKRKDGVLPETDVRNDKWETAIDARSQAAVIRLNKKAERDKPAQDSNGDTN